MKCSSQKYAYELVCSDLAGRIGRGEWGVGERIPALESLVEQYPYSHMTVFKALKCLENKGYLKMRRGSGAYVAKNGRQFSVAMMFCDDIFRAHKTPYASLIMEAGKKYMARREASYELYITDSCRDELTCKDFLAALKNRSFDGFIALGVEKQLETLFSSQLWKEYAIPYASMSESESLLCTVTQDVEEEVRLAFETISASRRKKVLLLGAPPEMYPRCRKLAGKYGISLELKDFSLEMSEDAPQEDRYEMFGLTTTNRILSGDHRPEAIVVLDDIVAKGVAYELFMREVKIPDEILFITHSNKGSGVFYPIPAIRLEFEPGKVVEAAGDMLWKSMTSGKQLEGNVTVAPKLIAAEKKSPIYVYS